MATHLIPALPGMQAHPTIYRHLHTTHINFLHLSSPSKKCENSVVLLLRRFVTLMTLNLRSTLIQCLTEPH